MTDMNTLSPNRSWAEAALFFGAIWGFTEATAGHILHLIKIPGLPGLVMLPIGIYFMLKAFLAAGKIKAIWLTASTASAIKLTDLAVSMSNPEAALNPAAAILCEALIVMAGLAVLRLVPDFRPTRFLFQERNN
jgi:hypothetical protein